MNLKDYASTRKTRGKYKVPKSVQQSIPVEKIYEDGIWKSGEVYSMMWSISDINYAMLSDERKKEIQNLYGAIYTAIPTDCWAKFSIISQRMDEQMFRRDILMHRTAAMMAKMTCAPSTTVLSATVPPMLVMCWSINT